MNDFDDLDGLFGELRSAATDAELAGETSHLDAMARHHRRQKGHTMITSRRARVAMFVAAGVIGFGGVAAAGPRGPFASTRSAVTTTSEVATTTSEVTTTSSEVTTTSSEVATTTSEVPSDDDPAITRSMIEQTIEGDDTELVDDLDTDFGDTCLGHDPEEFDNHGEFVRSVARNEPDFEDIEQRDAAQSPCGKDDVDEVEVKDDEVEVKDDDDDDSDDDGDDDSDDRDDDDGDDDSDDDGDDDGDDDDDDDDDDEDRPEKSDKSEKSQKPGNRGNGSKKNSGD